MSHDDLWLALATSLTEEQGEMWAAIVDHQTLRRSMDPARLARLDALPPTGAPTYRELSRRLQESLTPEQRALQARLFGPIP